MKSVETINADPLQLLKNALLSPGKEDLLKLVRQETQKILAALEEGEVDFSNEELRHLEGHGEWVGTVYAALEEPVPAGKREKEIAEAIADLCASEDEEIAEAFKSLVETAPVRFREWDWWFGRVPRAPKDYQERLRKETVVHKSSPYSLGLVVYGMTPATILEASRGVQLLVDRVLRAASEPHAADWLQADIPSDSVEPPRRAEKSLWCDLDLNAEVSESQSPSHIRLPYRLLLGQIRGTPQCPPEVAAPLLAWMVEVAQLKPLFFRGYLAGILGKGAIRLVQNAASLHKELPYLWSVGQDQIRILRENDERILTVMKDAMKVAMEAVMEQVKGAERETVIEAAMETVKTAVKEAATTAEMEAAMEGVKGIAPEGMRGSVNWAMRTVKLGVKLGAEWAAREAEFEAENAKFEAEKAEFEAESAKFEAEKAKFEALDAKLGAEWNAMLEAVQKSPEVAPEQTERLEEKATEDVKTVEWEVES